MITLESFMVPCGCRSVGECEHNLFAEEKALAALVDAFAERMKAKLIEKYRRNCMTGWDDPGCREYLRDSLATHVRKGDMVDVANIAAFLWNMEQP